MRDNLSMQESLAKTEEVLKLHKLMDQAFNSENSEEHLKMAIAAGIASAYSEGIDKGFEAGKYSVKIG